MIKLTNTMSGTKEEFRSIEPKKIGMYNCGPTVYGYPHIGNLRKYVFDDILRRMFEFNGYSVKQVINITDVGHIVADADTGEDKIELAAKKENKTAQEIAEYFTLAFYDDLEKLNIEAVSNKNKKDAFPKATDHIQEQIDLIKKLEEKDFTYKTSDGIYFDTAKFPKYGKLGNINLKGLQEGARVEVNTEKRNSTDFALWKFSPPAGGPEKRQQEWPSPWGVGFPGWHIECSAMSMKYLGETFDIHTGGIDHIPVHHNNEIAQSEAATGKPFAKYWLHEAFVNVEGGKMAKSIGNIFRLKDLEDNKINPLAYRYWLLTAHYRTQINFTWDAIEAAQNAYNKLIAHITELGDEVGAPDKMYIQKFKEFINDDLNTPQAVALMWDLLKDQSISPENKKATILEFDKVFGLKLDSFSTKIVVPEEILMLAQEREEARKSKNFARADEIRDQILEKGFLIKDTESGPQLFLNKK